MWSKEKALKIAKKKQLKQTKEKIKIEKQTLKCYKKHIYQIIKYQIKQGKTCGLITYDYGTYYLKLKSKINTVLDTLRTKGFRIETSHSLGILTIRWYLEN